MKTGKSGFWSNLISAQVKFLKKWIHPKLGRINWKEAVNCHLLCDRLIPDWRSFWARLRIFRAFPSPPGIVGKPRFEQFAVSTCNVNVVVIYKGKKGDRKSTWQLQRRGEQKPSAAAYGTRLRSRRRGRSRSRRRGWCRSWWGGRMTLEGFEFLFDVLDGE